MDQLAEGVESMPEADSTQPMPAEPGGETVTTPQEVEEEAPGPDSEAGGGTITTPQETEERAERERDAPSPAAPGGETVTSPQELEDADDV